jgi:ATP-dependent Clp protease ATP-binding subunit ClpB
MAVTLTPSRKPQQSAEVDADLTTEAEVGEVEPKPAAGLTDVVDMSQVEVTAEDNAAVGAAARLPQVQQLAQVAAALARGKEINAAALALALLKQPLVKGGPVPEVKPEEEKRLKDLIDRAPAGKGLGNEAKALLALVERTRAALPADSELSVLQILDSTLREHELWQLQPAALAYRTVVDRHLTDAALEGKSLGDKKRLQTLNSSTYPTIVQLGEDLSLKNEKEPLRRALGREREVSGLLSHVRSSEINSCVLTGERGVGKTALVHEVVHRLDPNERLIRIPASKFKTTPPQKALEILKKLAEETAAASRQGITLYLFIDEIHNVPMDVIDEMKEYTTSQAGAGPRLNIIGATTKKEYDASIAQNGAAMDRLPSRQVTELSIEDTRLILSTRSQQYQDLYGIKVDDSALEFILRDDISAMADTQRPRGPLLLLDRAFSTAREARRDDPYQVQMLRNKIANLQAEILKANVRVAAGGDDGLVEKLQGALDASLKQLERVERDLSTERELTAQEAAIIKQLEAEPDPAVSVNRGDLLRRLEDVHGKLRKLPQRLLLPSVDAMAVAQYLAVEKNRTLESLGFGNDTERLLKAEEILAERIIDQPEIVGAVAELARSYMSGNAAKDKPAGVKIFAGPTGVGKTHSAEELAEFLFGDRNKLVRINCNELQEQHEVFKWIGAPPSYVGFEGTPMLADKHNSNGKAYVLLLDELEKAHPLFLQRLMQAIDKGVLVDNAGNEIDMRKVVIIGTSNLGAAEMGTLADDAEYATKATAIFEQALRERGNPEIFGRIGLENTVAGRPLNAGGCLRILDRKLKTFTKDVAENERSGWQLHVTDAMRDLLFERGFNPVYGGRPLEQAVKKVLEDAVNKVALDPEKNFRKGTVVMADVDYTEDPPKPDIRAATDEEVMAINSGEPLPSGVSGLAPAAAGGLPALVLQEPEPDAGLGSAVTVTPAEPPQQLGKVLGDAVRDRLGKLGKLGGGRGDD